MVNTAFLLAVITLGLKNAPQCLKINKSVNNSFSILFLKQV